MAEKTGTPEFGDLLTGARLAAGLSRRELADLAGLSYPYISQLETGYRRPSAEVIGTLAKIINLSPDDVIQALDSRELDTPEPGRGGSGSSFSDRSRSATAPFGGRLAPEVAPPAFAPPPLPAQAASTQSFAAAAPRSFAAAAGGGRPPSGESEPARPAAKGFDPADTGRAVREVLGVLSELPPRQRLDVTYRVLNRVLDGVIDDEVRQHR